MKTMKKDYNLNNRTMQELAQAVSEFFKKENSMETVILPMDKKHYIVRAEKYGKDFIDKSLGDNTSCTVELTEIENGIVSVQAGDGKWLGKAVGAAAVVMLGFCPACWPVYAGMILGTAKVGWNVHKQANLPTEVGRFIHKFLNNELKTNKE